MFVWSEFYCDIQKGLLLCKGNLHVPWCRVWDTNTFTCWVAVGTPLKEKPQACCRLLSANVFLFSLLDWAADPSILKMRLSLAISFFIFLSLWVEEACSKEKSSKKGKGKKKQYLCPSYVPQSYILLQSRVAAVCRKSDWLLKCPTLTLFTSSRDPLCPDSKTQRRQRFGVW